MCISHRLQCNIKVKINQVQIKILKNPTVDNFHLINSSKRYHVYHHTTIHLLDTKYGHYGSNTLNLNQISTIFVYFLYRSSYRSYSRFHITRGDFVVITAQPIRIRGKTVGHNIRQSNVLLYGDLSKYACFYAISPR
jgi:hypothetical protein